MRCPACQGTDSRVVDSRTTTDAIRRRRACSTCGHRFTTFERVERRVIWVQKKDGRKELFSREKILGGIALACRKRPVTATQMDQVVNEVEAHLQAASEPTSDLVGEAVMGALRSVDEVAYLRFASVYREFESVEQFLDTIRPLREPN